MKKVSKIIIVCLLITITTSTMFFLNKKESASSNGMFAIMLETSKDTGKYDYAKDNKWPQSDEYVINMYKTYCEKGSVLRWNNETKRINATVKGTDKCYVYFDLSEYGNEEHPYLIQTIEDLVRLSNDVNNGTTYAGKYFLLTNDLDFQDASDYEDANRVDFKDINGINGDEALIKEVTTGKGFSPIGLKNYNYFAGNFDGNNKRIENLYINYGDTDVAIGFFYHLKNSTIENLTISGNISKNGKNDIGGIASMASENTKILNCQNMLNVQNSSANNSTAGFIGSISGNVEIQNSCYFGTVNGGDYTAAFIGWSSGKLIISNCLNKGKIINQGGNHVGSMIGSAGINSNIFIINSFNYGNIEISSIRKNNSGGIVGNINGNIGIINSYNRGSISNTGNYYTTLGGILGSVNGSTNIINSFNIGQIDGNGTKYGIGYYDDNSIVTISNGYYDNSLPESNKSETGTGQSLATFTTKDFVNTLNENIKSINLREIDESLKGYKLNNWTLGSDGYPTLVII